jgi:hypothetical protein
MVKPEEEACPLCGEMVAAKRHSGAWEFTCHGTHATGESLTWTWEGDLGAPPSTPSWLLPPPLTAAQQAKADKKAASDAEKAAAAEAKAEADAAAAPAPEAPIEEAVAEAAPAAEAPAPEEPAEIPSDVSEDVETVSVGEDAS